MIAYRAIAVRITPASVVPPLAPVPLPPPTPVPLPTRRTVVLVGPAEPTGPWQKVGRATRLVAAELDMPVADIVGGSRRDPLVRARAAIAWIARRTSDRALNEIATALGRTDHTTVLQMLRKAEQLRDADPAFREMTDRIADWVSAGVVA